MHVFPLSLLIHHGQLYPPSRPRFCRQPRSSSHKKLPAASGADASRFYPLFYCCFPCDRGGRTGYLGVFVFIFIPSRIFSEPHLFFGTYILYKLVISLF
ncbi:hypothetical protein BDV33DRAFT_15541 [Aspergillus novoparasiticus]|uniref:Uncharacterized protein n=1 Tax=Aspergillus novoparasiticus TaxID=986946 RepID=A0A5N6ECR6_9EURO|nr:hypothetical protein BDV33DRAFT_15541 [Aspergillus novoparasiticus]